MFKYSEHCSGTLFFNDQWNLTLISSILTLPGLSPGVKSQRRQVLTSQKGEISRKTHFQHFFPTPSNDYLSKWLLFGLG